MKRRAVLGVALCSFVLSVVALSGCAPKRISLLEVTQDPYARGSVALRQEFAGTYKEVVRAHNERVSSLDRVWARAQTTFFWTEENSKGEKKEKNESGDGHWQWNNPGFALSVGKLGETGLWVGFDDQRYWVIDRHQRDLAYLGSHRALTQGQARALGLPARPADIVNLVGLGELKEPTFGDALSLVRLSADGVYIGVERPHPLGGSWRVTFDTFTGLPVHVRWVGLQGDIVVESLLADYEHVKGATSERAGDVLFPSKIELRESGQYEQALQLNLSSLSTKPRGMRAEVFDFSSLNDRLGPYSVVDLDAVFADRVRRGVVVEPETAGQAEAQPNVSPNVQLDAKPGATDSMQSAVEPRSPE